MSKIVYGCLCVFKYISYVTYSYTSIKEWLGLRRSHSTVLRPPSCPARRPKEDPHKSEESVLDVYNIDVFGQLQGIQTKQLPPHKVIKYCKTTCKTTCSEHSIERIPSSKGFI